MFLFQTHPTALTRRGFRDFRAFASGKVVALFLCAGFACAGQRASASTFRINISATNLTANTNYGLNFELQNGIVGNLLQASVSNFSLLGGTLGDGGSSAGTNPATGSLNGVLSLATTSVFDASDYIQNFSSTTGSALMAFTLNLSSPSPQTDPFAPDFFRLSFLDQNGTQVATTDVDDHISLVYAAFDSTSPSVQTYRTSSQSGPQAAAQIQPSAAPEPGTLALLLPSGAGIGGAVWLQYRRKRAATRA